MNVVDRLDMLISIREDVQIIRISGEGDVSLGQTLVVNESSRTPRSTSKKPISVSVGETDGKTELQLKDGLYKEGVTY